MSEWGMFAGREQALAWLDAEQANLTAAVGLAVDTQRYLIAVDLAFSLAEFLGWWRQLTDGVTVAQVAATHLKDPVVHANAVNNLGVALREVRCFDEASTAHTTASREYRPHRYYIPRSSGSGSPRRR